MPLSVYPHSITLRAKCFADFAQTDFLTEKNHDFKKPAEHVLIFLAVRLDRLKHSRSFPYIRTPLHYVLNASIILPGQVS